MGRAPRVWTLKTLCRDRCTYDTHTQCWEWKGKLGGRADQRKPLIHSAGHVCTATRFAYALSKGKAPADLPSELNVWSGCRNPKCINPAHLRAGTRAEMCEDLATLGTYTRSADVIAKITASKRASTRAKLTIHDARRIRAASGTLREIADAEGVSYSLVSLIKTGRAWRESATGRTGQTGFSLLASAWTIAPTAPSAHTEGAAA